MLFHVAYREVQCRSQEFTCRIQHRLTLFQPGMQPRWDSERDRRGMRHRRRDQTKKKEITNTLKSYILLMQFTVRNNGILYISRQCQMWAWRSLLISHAKFERKMSRPTCPVYRIVARHHRTHLFENTDVLTLCWFAQNDVFFRNYNGTNMKIVEYITTLCKIIDLYKQVETFIRRAVHFRPEDYDSLLITLFRHWLFGQLKA